MALRLTGPTRTSTPPRAAERTAPAAALGKRGTALLAAGDLAGHRTLFAEAAAIADPHVRYLARRTLVETLLAAAGASAPARVAPIYLAVAQETVALLEESPAEPLFLSYAGVALYELWALRAAEALFTAARRLAPELPNVDANLLQLARRRAQKRAPLSRSLARLSERAQLVAKQARPVEGHTLSLCMIVKDEEEMLPRCLAAAAPAVDEIVVVDTGSSDRTIEIARSFGARVIEHPWNGSFSDARNVSFDAATGDWLMFLDADEVLVPEDAEVLRTVRGQVWREAFHLVETNYTGEIGDGSATVHTPVRVFRARPEYRFSGRLHEQILDKLPTYLPERFHATNVRIEHYGYLGAVREAKEKSRRNIELLERQRDEEAPDAFLHFNLASEHAALNENERALREFQRAWDLVERDRGVRRYGFEPALAGRYVRALRICRRNEECIARADEALARFDGFTDLVFEQGAALRALGRDEKAIATFERCLEMGDAPGSYTATVGMGTFLPAIQIAELLMERRRDGEAVERLARVVAAHPDVLALVLPYVTAMVRAEVDPDAVVARIEEQMELSSTMRFMLATALYEQGALEVAEGQFRLLVERQPASGRNRVAHAEALLSLRRNGEAAEVASDVPDDDTHGAAARRSELFARLADGDVDGARAVLEDRGEALPACERELFAAWVARAAGQEGPAALSADAVPLLVVTLEALLRIQDVDGFAALVALLQRTVLPERERRETLAAMYLRRGFVASAAEEWLAVCQEGAPDTRALVGLAQVAATQGLTDDALNFAREAHALDPADARAARLLERLTPLAA